MDVLEALPRGLYKGQSKNARRYLEKQMNPPIVCNCGARDGREKKVGRVNHKAGCVYAAGLDILTKG